MKKAVVALLILTAAGAGPAMAQSGRDAPASDPRAGTLNEHHITGTGATVPNPGASQGAGTTPLDRGVERRDDQIGGSICKGC